MESKILTQALRSHSMAFWMVLEVRREQHALDDWTQTAIPRLMAGPPNQKQVRTGGKFGIGWVDQNEGTRRRADRFTIG